MSVLTSMLRRLGVAEAETTARRIATSIWRTSRQDSEKALSALISANPTLQERLTPRTWRHILDTFDTVGTRRPDLISRLPEIEAAAPRAVQPTLPGIPTGVEPRLGQFTEPPLGSVRAAGRAPAERGLATGSELSSRGPGLPEAPPALPFAGEQPRLPGIEPTTATAPGLPRITPEEALATGAPTTSRVRPHFAESSFTTRAIRHHTPNGEPVFDVRVVPTRQQVGAEIISPEFGVIAPEDDPLSLLLREVDDELLDGEKLTTHPLFKEVFDRFRSQPGSPHRPPPRTVDVFEPPRPEVAESIKQEALAKNFRTEVTDLLLRGNEANPEIGRRLRLLKGHGMSDAQRIDQGMEEISRIFTDPLPNPSQPTRLRVQALGLQIAGRLGIRTPKTVDSLKKKAARLRSGLRVQDASVADPRVADLTRRIDAAEQQLAQIQFRATSAEAAGKQVARLQRKIETLTKQRAEAARRLGLETGVTDRVRWADALLDAVVEPLAKRDRERISQAARLLTLLEQPKLMGSIPEPSYLVTVNTLIGEFDRVSGRQAVTRVGQELTAAGVVKPSVTPEFREIIRGAGGISVQGRREVHAIKDPRIGSLMRIKSAQKETLRLPPSALSIPERFKDTDLLVVDAVTAKIVRPEGFNVLAEDLAHLQGRLARAAEENLTRAQIRKLRGAVGRARIAVARAKRRGKQAAAAETTRPAIVVARVGDPTDIFVIEPAHLKRVAEGVPNEARRSEAEAIRKALSERVSPQQVMDQLTVRGGLAVTRAGGEGPTAWIIRRAGPDSLPFPTADPAVVQAAALEGAQIRQFTARNSYDAITNAANAASEELKESIVKGMIGKARERLQEAGTLRANMLDLLFEAGGRQIEDPILQGRLLQQARKEMIRQAQLRSSDATEAGQVLATRVLESEIARAMAIRFPREYSRWGDATVRQLPIEKLETVVEKQARAAALRYDLDPATAEFRIASWGTEGVNLEDFRILGTRGAKALAKLKELDAPAFLLIANDRSGRARVVAFDLTSGGRVAAIRDPQAKGVQEAYDRLSKAGIRGVKGPCGTEGL